MNLQETIKVTITNEISELRRILMEVTRYEGNDIDYEDWVKRNKLQLIITKETADTTRYTVVQQKKVIARFKMVQKVEKHELIWCVTNKITEVKISNKVEEL